MNIEKVGLNLTSMENISAPDFNFSTSVSDFIKDIPVKANNYTNGYLGGIVMVVLFGYLYWRLTDLGATGEFRFSKIRGIGLASGIAGTVGMVMISIGYYTQLYPVVFFLLVFMVAFAWVVKEER